jgi:putative phosphoesterase
MKFVIFSDVHGQKNTVEKILSYYPKSDYFISLGDSGLEEEYLISKDIVHVKGNIHKDAGTHYNITMTVDDITIFLTHGHKFKVHKSLDYLKKQLMNINADIAFFGHTHVAYFERFNNIFLVNPGSCTLPRNTLPPTFVVMDVQNGNIDITFHDVVTNNVIEIS